MDSFTDWQHQLPDNLPAGELLVPDRIYNPRWDGGPVAWVSDEPLPDAADWWCRLSRQQDSTGLRPFLTTWKDTYCTPRTRADIESREVERQLARDWGSFKKLQDRQAAEPPSWDDLPEGVEFPDDDPGPPYESWPGLAPATPPHPDPDASARTVITQWVPHLGKRLHLGLSPAARSADIPALGGWETAWISAVLRTWEDRFGARFLGFDDRTLLVSVASPPTTPEHSTHIALEHLLFCPDNIYQGAHENFPAYAEAIRGAHCWDFWWD